MHFTKKLSLCTVLEKLELPVHGVLKGFLCINYSKTRCSPISLMKQSGMRIPVEIEAQYSLPRGLSLRYCSLHGGGHFAILVFRIRVSVMIQFGAKLTYSSSEELAVMI